MSDYHAATVTRCDSRAGFGSYIYCGYSAAKSVFRHLPLLRIQKKSRELLYIFVKLDVGAGERAVPKYWPTSARKEKKDKTTISGQWTQRCTVDRLAYAEPQSNEHACPHRTMQWAATSEGVPGTPPDLLRTPNDPTRVQTIVYRSPSSHFILMLILARYSVRF